MEWKEEYCIGIKEIDDQHKALVNMITKLQISAAKGNEDDVMRKVIIEIVDYTKFHFAEEEKLMNRIGFPERGYHMTLHKDLILQVIGILKKLKLGKTLSVNDLIKFLEGWLINHIIKEDLKTGTYYRHVVKNDDKA